ncbi:MAG: flavodoxin family protein [Methanobacteriaceae archaeon]|nr:flavodoxin family protein [Methanobacteriaceae archaeon]
MNAVTLITSPVQNGHEFLIAEKITEGIESNGGDNTILFLNDYIIDPCQACQSCTQQSECIQDDDFIELTEEIREADAFIFLAPIYFGGISGQAKTFLDRFYSISSNFNKNFEGKKTVIIITSGSEEKVYDEYCKTLDKPFIAVNLDVKTIWHVGELLIPGKINPDVSKKAKEIGEKL